MKRVVCFGLALLLVVVGRPMGSNASPATQPATSQLATSQPAGEGTAAFPHFGVTVPLFDGAEIIPEPIDSQIVAQGWPSTQPQGGLDRVLTVFLVGRTNPGETVRQFAVRQSPDVNRNIIGDATWGGLPAVMVGVDASSRRGLSTVRTAFAIHDGFGYALVYLDNVEPQPNLEAFEFTLSRTVWSPRTLLPQSLRARANLTPLASSWGITAPEPLRPMRRERPDMTTFFAQDLVEGDPRGAATRALMLKVITAGPNEDFGSLDATKEQVVNAVFKPRGLSETLPWRELPSDEILGEGAVSAPFKAANGEWMATVIRRDSANNSIVIIASARLIDESDDELAFLAKYLAAVVDSIQHKKG
jgi:hypothetical protein